MEKKSYGNFWNCFSQSYGFFEVFLGQVISINYVQPRFEYIKLFKTLKLHVARIRRLEMAFQCTMISQGCSVSACVVVFIHYGSDSKRSPAVLKDFRCSLHTTLRSYTYARCRQHTSLEKQIPRYYRIMIIKAFTLTAFAYARNCYFLLW